LRLPLVAKDDIKEALADSLGVTDEEWSRRLGAATWEVMFVLMERFVSAHASSIFESNFYPEIQRQRFDALRSRHPFIPFEVHCCADPATLVGRNADRDRHPIHWLGGVALTPESAAEWSASNSPLRLSEHLIRVDTSTSEPVDLDEIVRRIKEVRDDTDG
jgi:hypothetical protein